MKYTVEIGSGTMMYIPSFIKSGSAIKMLIGGLKETQRAWKSYAKNVPS
jgi:hypothetical protein